MNLNVQDLTTLGNKITSFLSQLDMDHVRDDLLDRAHLRRQRPVLMTASAVGLVGLGAVAAFAVVAFVPQVRAFFTNDRGVAEKARNIVGTATDAVSHGVTAAATKATNHSVPGSA